VAGPVSRGPERVVLDNGLTVVVERVPSAPVFTAMLVVEAGSRFDPPGRAGLAALTGGVLVEGTNVRSARSMALAVDSLGSALDSVTGYETTAVVGSGLGEHCSETLLLLAEVVTSPRMSRSAVEECVRRQVSELADDSAQAYERCRQVFMSTVFDGHARANPVGGLVDDVLAMTHRDTDAFHRAFYRPDRAVLSIAGDLPRAELVEAASESLGGWTAPAAAQPREPEPPSPAEGRRVSFTRMDSRQVHVIVGNVALARSDPLYYAAAVMDVILGDSAGFGSRLATRLREREGLAYVIESDASGTAGVEPGVFWAYSATSPGQFERLLEGLMQELLLMRAEPPSDDELAAAVGYLTGRDVLDRETSDAVAGRLVHAERHGLGLDFDERFPEHVESVTREAVLEAARRFIDPDTMTLAVVGPLDAEGVSFPDLS